MSPTERQFIAVILKLKFYVKDEDTWIADNSNAKLKKL